MKTCQHCQQPLLDVACDGCCGAGYLWARDEVGDTPIDCWECHGEGRVYPCTNTECPGLVWYPLSRDDNQVLRMVERVMREEKLGK